MYYFVGCLVIFFYVVFLFFLMDLFYRECRRLYYDLKILFRKMKARKAGAECE
mgnify:CR=1 FL=1